MRRPNTYKVIGYQRLGFFEGAGFALPLFRRNEGDNEVYVQDIGEYKSIIAGFTIADGTTCCSLDGPRAWPGEKVIYVFVDDDYHAHAGTVEELHDVLRGYKSSHPIMFGINCQIEELIGDAEDKLQAHADLINRLSDSVRPRALEICFIELILRPIIWTEMLSKSDREEMAQIILTNRRSIGLKYIKEGEFVIQIPSVVGGLFSQGQLQDIVKKLEMEYLYIGKRTKLFKNKGKFVITSFKIDEYFRPKRQEGRIARLLRQYVENYETGRASFEDYFERQDIKTFERKALYAIDEAIFSRKGEFVVEDQRLRELQVADLVPRLYSIVFPMSKGVLLLCLASELGHYRLVNDAIRRKLDASNAFVVDDVRDDVRHLLGQKLQQF